MKIRKKKCIVCGESFTPQRTSLQRCCTIDCAITYSKLKAANTKEGLNKMRNEKDSIEKLSKVTAYTQEVVNKYIRQRDKGKPCVSCGKSWDSSFQACHRFNVKQFNKLRFDLDNIHGGCPGCNQYNDGNYNAYHIRLPKRIGIEVYQDLQKRADIAFRIPWTWTRYELKEIQKTVRELTKKL